MKKKEKDSKLKKQLVSGGIYIALAAAMITVTLNGVNKIVGTKNDIEIPDTEINVPDIRLELPEMNLQDQIFDIPEEGNINLNEAASENTHIGEIFVSDHTDGINNIVTEETLKNENSADGRVEEKKKIVDKELKMQNDGEKENEIDDVSGEPSDVEYPTEPDEVMYGIYSKPADGYIDREFSTEKLFYSATMGDYRTHNGIDITGELGSAVKAISDGVVCDVYYDDFYGHTVAIDHGDGVVAHYMNLSENIPKEICKGAMVSIGQTIGGIGESAAIESADIAHLHLSIIKNGVYIDPDEFLRQ